MTTSAIEALANDLYVRVVRPELTWWDDLTPEVQEGWLDAARWVAAIEAEAIRQERERLRELWDRVHPEAMHIRHADECVAPLCATMRRTLAEP